MKHSKLNVSDFHPRESLPLTHENLLPVTEKLRSSYVDSQEMSRPKAAFGVATAVFTAALMGAITDYLPMWAGLVGIAGLVITGLTYVAAWSLDNVRY